VPAARASGLQYYDLVLTQGSVNVTQFNLASAIAFTARPSITSVTSQYCPPDWTLTYLKVLLCPPGAVLTIVGTFFSPAEQLSVLVSLPPGAFPPFPPIPCTDVALSSPTTLTCVLPAINNTSVQATLQSYANNLQVYENATSYSELLPAALTAKASTSPPSPVARALTPRPEAPMAA
jgi:hypothetical protein